MKFEVLYSFGHDGPWWLVEIKYWDKDGNKKLQWLVMNDEDEKISELTFIAMKSENGQEDRQFQEGALRFNRETAFLKFDAKKFYLASRNILEAKNASNLLLKYIHSL